MRLTIADDGSGFDAEQVPKGHLGLAIMRERAESLGGEVELVTAVGEGTTLQVRYPRTEVSE